MADTSRCWLLRPWGTPSSVDGVVFFNGHVYRDMAKSGAVAGLRSITTATPPHTPPPGNSLLNVGEGAARGWRERRLRSRLRHERPSVAVVLAEFKHHSSIGQRMARAKKEEHELNCTAKVRMIPPSHGVHPGVLACRVARSSLERWWALVGCRQRRRGLLCSWCLPAVLPWPRWRRRRRISSSRRGARGSRRT